LDPDPLVRGTYPHQNSRIPNTVTVLSEASQQLLFISDFCSQVSNFMLHVRIRKCVSHSSDPAVAPLCVYHNYKPFHHCCGSVTFWYLRIRIRGFVPLTKGSGAGTGRPKTHTDPNPDPQQY
jgi:hypothetical protein